MPKSRTAKKEVKKIAFQRKAPFKSHHFSIKHGKTKPYKTLKQIIQAEKYELYPPSIPNYQSIEAGPSTLPAKKYCDLSGHLSKYTDPKTGIRFCEAAEHPVIKHLSQEHIENYLSLRRAVVIIR